MNFDDDEKEKKHHILLENFLLKGNLNAFKKMLNIEPNKISKNTFFNTTKTKQIKLYKKVRRNQNIKTELNNNFSFNNNESYNYNNSCNIILERHLDYADPKYKNKCMKGNYKWASMRFQMMKANLAKRKEISIDEFKMPKIWSKKKNNNKNLYENFDTKKNNFFKQVKSQDKTLNIKEDHKNTFHTDKINKFPNVYKGKYQPLKRLPSHKNPNTFVI